MYAIHYFGGYYCVNGCNQSTMLKKIWIQTAYFGNLVYRLQCSHSLNSHIFECMQRREHCVAYVMNVFLGANMLSAMPKQPKTVGISFTIIRTRVNDTLPVFIRSTGV